MVLGGDSGETLLGQCADDRRATSPMPAPGKAGSPGRFLLEPPRPCGTSHRSQLTLPEDRRPGFRWNGRECHQRQHPHSR